MGSATFINKATKASYEFSFDLNEGETAIEKAWSLVNLVGAINNWNATDIKPTNIK